jgi:hypothetical protein
VGSDEVTLNIRPMVGWNLASPAIRAQMRSILRHLPDPALVYIEAATEPEDVVEWLQQTAPRLVVRILSGEDGKFRALLCSRLLLEADGVPREERTLAQAVKDALLALSAFDEQQAATLAAQAYTRLPPESRVRPLLDGLLHRFTHAYHRR